MKKSFEVEIDFDTAIAFAELSGDWNPLHTDETYAATTSFKRPLLHGAYSAGLVSRMAGMFLPGTECLLHNMRLNFVAPISQPTILEVAGSVVRETDAGGSVDVSIRDKANGRLYVSASYSYGFHKKLQSKSVETKGESKKTNPNDPVVLVTGANGGLASALVEMLDCPVLGVSRNKGGPLSCS